MVQNVCGNSRISGVSFSIHPMSDQFVDIILGALEKTNTSKVWVGRDDVTTTIRGKTSHIFDVSAAAFIHAVHSGKHVAFNATYSVGCPGDSDGDVFMAEDDLRLNEEIIENADQYVAAKFSLYPLGGGNYMDTIYEQIDAIKKYVTVTRSHYSTRLDGNVKDVFHGLEQIFHATEQSGVNHLVMTVTISANSPSHQKQ